MPEYQVKVKNTSNNKIEEYNLRIDGEKVSEQPVELEEGEHKVEVSGDSFEDAEKTVELECNLHDVIVVESKDGVYVNPDTDCIETLISEELAEALDTLDRDIHVNKASERHIELYCRHTEVAEIEVLDSNNPNIAHEYEYEAKMVIESESEYRRNDKKKAFCERFESPKRAVKEIEDRIMEEVYW